jgi:hypothetical protein
MAIATPVQCTGRSREEPDSGPLSPSPRKPASAPLPGHGFPRDIAMTALAPGRGWGDGGERSVEEGTKAGYGLLFGIDAPEELMLQSYSLRGARPLASCS